MADNQRFRVRDRVRYEVDNALTRGVWVVLLWMGAGLLGAVVIIGIVIWVWQAGPGDQPIPLYEGIWIALTRSLDPGTFGQDTGPRFRVSGLAITVIGLLAIALLIGLIANAVDRRLEDLRQGRSIVLESDHTLVLGFSAKLSIVIRELIEASAGARRHTVVILSPHDKVELEHILRREVPKSRTKIIVRRGEPSSLLELEQGRPRWARNVVVLRPDEADADAEVIKCVLAVCKSREGLEQVPMVAEFQDAEAARGLRQALPGQVMTVVTSEVVARVAAQTSRAAGLGTLYQEFLDFDGDELYLVDVPGQLVGRPFADALLASDTSCVLGIRSLAGDVQLCPNLDDPLMAGDQLVVLAENHSTIRFADDIPSLKRHAPQELVFALPRAERTLIVGWNDMAARIVAEIDENVDHGSTLHILLDRGLSGDLGVDLGVDLATNVVNQEIAVHVGSTMDRESIDQVISYGPFDHILVLCQHEGVSAPQSDARALVALLHVRNAVRDRGGDHARANIVTEVLQSEAVDLAQVAKPDDFIVSQRLVSLLLAQLVEDPRRKPILQELLDSHGAQLHLIRVEDCGLVGRFTQREIISRMASAGGIALGWESEAYRDDPRSLSGGLRVNPHKDETVDLCVGDRIVVLARDAAPDRTKEIRVGHRGAPM